MRALRLCIVTTACLSWVTGAQTIEFFYTETLDTCDINGASIQANEQTTHGGVCAYRQDVDRVYACPAPDPKCWTWAQECNEDGIGQTICNRGGSVFCCNSVAGETCTTTEGQINVCISNFTSPNSDVPLDRANEVYLAAIGVEDVTATSQSVDPTPFSTQDLSSTLTATSAAATSTETNGSGAVSQVSTGSMSKSITSGSTSATGTDSSRSSVAADVQASSSLAFSGGAIAGIVIGALVVCVLLGVVFFFCSQRKKAEALATSYSKEPNVPSSDYEQAKRSNEKALLGDFYGSQSATSELGSESVSRFEMPVTNTQLGNAHANYRHELP